MNKLPRAIAVRYDDSGNKYRLVRDEFHGHTRVWKIHQYIHGYVDGWFDCSPHFHSKQFAMQWFNDKFHLT